MLGVIRRRKNYRGRCFLWKSCALNGIIVDMKAKRSSKALPKKKVVVRKAAFDAVLAKLIQSKPVKRAWN
jgi:hypothetical protein